MPLKIKVPVSELEKSNVCEIVRKTLESDSNNAYTIMGLMVEKFGVKENEILGKPFSQWKRGYPTMYTRIRKCLEQLKEKGLLKSKKHEKAEVYWWNKSK